MLKLNKTYKMLIAMVTLLFALAGCGDTVNNTTAAIPAPETPQAVQAVAADGQVTVSWRPAANATSYNIYWKLSSGVTTADSVIVNASSPYLHQGLANGAACYYAVAAVNMEGESGLSAEISATPAASTAVPAAPLNLRLTPSDGQIVVSWDPVAGASYYNIYWAAEPGVTAASNRISTNLLPYTHTGLAATTTYYYRVSAVNDLSEGALSAEVTAMARLKFSRMLQKVMAGDAQASDNFGYSVAISGDYAIVGAPYEDGGAGNPRTDAGAAYIFHRIGPDSWDNGVKIIASDSQASDYFGLSVAISGDYAIVGSNMEGGGPGDPRPYAGAAYIFHRIGPNAWDSGTKIMAPDAQTGDYFGYSVSISGDYAIAGAEGESGGLGDPRPDSGAAYIFHRIGTNTWDSGVKIVASDAQSFDYFGSSVSLSGDYAIVGAFFEDGGTGDPLTDTGAAYIFHRTGVNTWDSGVKLVAPDGQAGDDFGISVSLSGDYAIVGALNEDGGPGDPLPTSGAAYIFHRNDVNTWDSGVKISAPDAQAGDRFGCSVSISGDTAIVGALNEAGGPGNPLAYSGAAYLFHRIGTNTWDNGAKIVAPDAEWGDDFGVSVAVSGDDAIVGAELEDGGAGGPLGNAGTAYFY